MNVYFQKALEGKIDFVGQESVENISKNYLTAITAFAFMIGFAVQSLRVTFAIFGVSTLVLLLIVVPPWPMFNKHPVQWAPSKETKKDK